MDRAFASGAKGQGFEFPRALHPPTQNQSTYIPDVASGAAVERLPLPPESTNFDLPLTGSDKRSELVAEVCADGMDSECAGGSSRSPTPPEPVLS